MEILYSLFKWGGTVIPFQIRRGLTSFLWLKPIPLNTPCVQKHQVYGLQKAFHVSAGDIGVWEVEMAPLY